MKRLTRDEYIERAERKWGDKNDYSMMEYKGLRSEILIVCRRHGPFTQNASNHLYGEGCPKCQAEKRPHRVADVGKNNSYNKVFGTVAYQEWKNMMHRCYDKKNHKKHPSYIGCIVCEEWKEFLTFKKWYDRYGVEGWALDKDILHKGNKLYSPDTCVYIPKQLNSLLVNRRSARGIYPIGVTKYNDKYRARLNKKNKEVLIGSFSTPEEAFVAYKKAKELYIKEVAQQYFDKGFITERVRDALFSYRIEITD